MCLHLNDGVSYTPDPSVFCPRFFLLSRSKENEVMMMQRNYDNACHRESY